MTLHLISHALCPYVQRAAIALAEKGVAFRRTVVDLSDKPAWFLEISPLGKTPVLIVDDVAIFESAVILEYLEETQVNPLHPADPLDRAQHRSWIEFGSAILNDIAGFYSADEAVLFDIKAEALQSKFGTIERVLGDGPFFDGDRFSLVDAVFGPVFRYFDRFDAIGEFGILSEVPKVRRWRAALAARPSVKGAVGADYPELLGAFIDRKGSHLAALQNRKRLAA
jgi:glutathione S-transferase